MIVGIRLLVIESVFLNCLGDSFRERRAIKNGFGFDGRAVGLVSLQDPLEVAASTALVREHRRAHQMTRNIYRRFQDSHGKGGLADKDGLSRSQSASAAAPSSTSAQFPPASARKQR